MPRSMLVLALLFPFGAAVEGCTRDREPPESTAKAPSQQPPPAEARTLVATHPGRNDAERAALDRARAATQTLLRTLKTRLTTVLAAEGLTAAVKVCADEAQRLTADVGAGQGVTAARSSAKLRNRTNAGPAWVASWLSTHDGRPAAEVAPGSGIASTEAGDVARFIAPIGLEPLCLDCHGPKERIPAEVQSVLRERYPDDAATGYAIGDLRGAVWAEAPVAG